MRLTERFEHAIGYALAVHGADVRKGTGVPYAAHLLAVASLVLEVGGDEDEAIAALLHDAAEDHGGEGRLVDIEARFGVRVASIVKSCSDSLTEDANAKAPYLVRKRDYIRHFWSSMSDPITGSGYVRVALADKLHNARSIARDVAALGDAAYERFVKPHEGDSLDYAKLKQHCYYSDLLRCFRHTDRDDLRATVDQLEAAIDQFTSGARPSLFDLDPPEAPPWQLSRRPVREMRRVTSRAAVIDAVREFDAIGEEHFLDKYGFGVAQEYELVIDDRRYPSKAIYGVAHGKQFPELGPLSSHEYSGGRTAAAKWLEQLGFVIVRVSRPNDR